jgi:proline dehydrogenase
MAYVVAEPCIRCRYTDCVTVCPVEAFKAGKNFLVIDPDICVDCELCVPECPTEAIFSEETLPEKWAHYKEINERYSQEWPVISEQQDPLPDADSIRPRPRTRSAPNREGAALNLLDRTVAAVVPRLPRRLVGAVARRYISGETLESALTTTAALNERGFTTTLDVLGENITRIEQTEPTVATYREVVARLAEGELDGNISVKPTHLGLHLDPDRCYKNFRVLLDETERRSMFLRIDMEDSSTTTATLDLYRRLRSEGHDGIGVVLQSYLHRSEEDARTLTELGARVRVCKGIYREPPEIAFQDPEEIRRSFLSIVDILLSHGCHVGIATHDASLIQGSYRLLDRAGGLDGLYEFQMLLGVTESLRDSVLAAGHPLRVYVPFGRDWYAYSIRRLRENPQIAGHVFRAMFGIG